VTNGPQKFYEHWRNNSTESSFFNKEFSYTLSLGVDSSCVPFSNNGALGDRILITKAYDDMFHRLLRRRAEDEGNARGAVLTGQPGVGASP
jgi:hypothetical protein